MTLPLYWLYLCTVIISLKCDNGIKAQGCHQGGPGGDRWPPVKFGGPLIAPPWPDSFILLSPEFFLPPHICASRYKKQENGCSTTRLFTDLPRRGTLPTQRGHAAAPESVPRQLLRGVFPGAGGAGRQWQAGRERGGQLKPEAVSRPSPAVAPQHNMQQVLSNPYIPPNLISSCMCDMGIRLHPLCSPHAAGCQGNQPESGLTSINIWTRAPSGGQIEDGHERSASIPQQVLHTQAHSLETGLFKCCQFLTTLPTNMLIIVFVILATCFSDSLFSVLNVCVWERGRVAASVF